MESTWGGFGGYGRILPRGGIDVTNIPMIKFYKVGGCVRDTLLGLKPKDIDYVVTGATPDILLSQGYKQVGASFPVFLYDGVEFALARTERKIGEGHKGFETFFDPGVTIEEDLLRRDLTINAIAMDDLGNIIDPYGGRIDLKNEILRHVSPAFEDDPLRILRVARFAATYDFTVNLNTLKLMRKMVRRNDLSTLPEERIVGEILKAMAGDYYWRFFEVLDECGAYNKLFKGREYSFMTDKWTGMMAVANDFSINQRIALFFLEQGKLKSYSKIIDRIGFSNDVKELVNFSNRLLDMFISSDDDNDIRCLFKKIKFILKSDKIGNLLPQIINLFRILEIDISLLAYFVKEARKIKFRHLTEDQQRKLKGEDIQKAIDELIKEKILNIHMEIKD